MCSEMAADLEPCRSLVWYAAHTIRAIPDEATLMACHAKRILQKPGSSSRARPLKCMVAWDLPISSDCTTGFKRIGFNRQLLGAPEVVREEAAVAQGWV
ncbi:MAG: hypothetical protein Ct9H300mP8_11470 [Gammaproteobacteria bacterium]|nr:MAG: hypothetical protein Ct9H300mP8_11470 [Gammaproteobacteria bacterium]